MAARMHLDLRVDLADDVIVGQLAPVGGQAQAFVGYAGLIATLESIRRGEIAGSMPPASRRRGRTVPKGGRTR
jgi:hypothetical protein